MLRTSPSSDEMAVIVKEINSIKEKTWDLHGAVLKLHRKKDRASDYNHANLVESV